MGASEKTKFGGTQVVDVPHHDMSIYIAPGASEAPLLRTAYWLLTGRHWTGSDVRELRHLLPAPERSREHRLVVVQDPIERFVAGFQALKDAPPNREWASITFDQCISSFPRHMRDAEVRERMNPQYVHFGGMLISSFTEVFLFSDFYRIFDRLDLITKLNVPRYQLSVSFSPEPVIEHWHLDFLYLYLFIDYANGFEESSL